MQFPGMCTDPVRLSLDVTWWPPSDDFSMSRRLWTRPGPGADWQLEDMATTGTPVSLVTLRDRWTDAARVAIVNFAALVENQAQPFPDR